MYGADWCSDCRRSKAVLDASGVAWEYIDIETVDGAPEKAESISGRKNIPVVVFPDASFQVEPSDAALRDKIAELGLV